MKKTIHYILISVMSLLALVSCDIHEYFGRHNERVKLLLHLDFNTEMPLHKEVIYTSSRDSKTNIAADHHDVRYIINVYHTDNVLSDNREADTTFVFTKSDITDLNYTAQLELYEGTYTFRVWTDYVEAGSIDDKYYDTHDFSEIILADKRNHSGSNDFREAFRGVATVTLINPLSYTGSVNSIDNQVTVKMMRPMGKFKFVSTDVDVFLNRVEQMMKEQGNLMSSEAELDNNSSYNQLLGSIDLSDFYVLFRYSAFMPCSFNMFTDKPADSWTGMTFNSRMFVDKAQELCLGYDYIFVNGSETTISVALEIYSRDGKLISSSRPIDIPIVRNELTVVKGEFLTSKGSGGITINPGYDGNDFNIELQ